ncbi:MAG: hypothetical protein WC405_15620 [Syntrophales bacterium]
MSRNIALTLDTDWAPDFAIDHVMSTLIENSVKATWFITHKSPATARLAQYPELFELGIHPNFNAGSSHGRYPEAVMDHCMNLVPQALSMRSHGLVQSTSLLKLIMTNYPLRVDVSLFLPYQFESTPFLYTSWGQSIFRIPYIWEDDHEMEQPRPDWSADRLLKGMRSLGVINFHPIHIYLNSSDMNPYQQVKKLGMPLCDCLPQHLPRQIINDNEGAGTLFARLIILIKEDFQSLNIRDIYQQWLAR